MSRPSSPKNGPTPEAPQNQPPPQQMPLLRTTVLHAFSFSVEVASDGSRQIVITVPPGERILLPFAPEPAERLGHAMLAPSVFVPDGPLQ